MTRRPKANEVFWSNPPALVGGEATWAEVFPNLLAADITVIETRYSQQVGRSRMKYPPGFPKFVDCSNSMCYGGGYDIQRFIGDLYRCGAASGDDLTKCRGNEGSPKGRRITGPCLHMFDVHGTLVYREPPPGAPAEDEPSSPPLDGDT